MLALALETTVLVTPIPYLLLGLLRLVGVFAPVPVGGLVTPEGPKDFFPESIFEAVILEGGFADVDLTPLEVLVRPESTLLDDADFLTTSCCSIILLSFSEDFALMFDIT